MNNRSLVLLAASLVSMANPLYAGLSSLPQWANGNLNCTIDGRPARMSWQVVDDPHTECEGNICTSTSDVKTIGRFSDNGGPWVELALVNTQNFGKTMDIRYLGAEQDNWQLTFDASTEVANGWTTWRGNHYPLSCWKGEKPLPTRCDEYANHAVQQYATAQRLFCGISPDARWQNNYAAHYGWCMQLKGNPVALQSETKARSDAIAACRRNTISPSHLNIPPR